MSTIIAIGDIHGCFNELQALLQQIEKNIPEAPIQYVFLGDYIDRGPDSNKVIEFLMYFQKHYNSIFLLGNHEDMMLNEPNLWMVNGGRATIKSYNGKIPEDHIQFIKNFKLYHVDEMNRVFVHAGIQRRVEKMEDQHYNYMIWTREQFFNDNYYDNRFVVHGHTPLIMGKKSDNHVGEETRKLPHVLANRVNLDTGCYYGGALSAALFNKYQTKPYMLINHLGEME